MIGGSANAEPLMDHCSSRKRKFPKDRQSGICAFCNSCHGPKNSRASALVRFSDRDVRFLQIKWLQRGNETLPASDKVVCLRAKNRQVRTAWNRSDRENRRFH